MNQTGPHLANRGEFQRATENERLLKAEQQSHKQKKKIILGEVSSFGDKRVLLGGLPHLPLGNREGLCDRLPYCC